MPTTNFYPSLSTLISVDNIPDNFGVFRDGITQLFSHLYYRDLQITKSVNGDAAFYNLKLLTYRRLSIEIPGTNGLALVLNPSLDETVVGSNTVIPTSLSYKWSILKYSKTFEDLASFDFSPRTFKFAT